RFLWDVHLQPLTVGGGGRGGGGLPISAVPFNTVPAATTPWANPGAYTVRLTVDGKAYTQPITVKQDPRVKTPTLAMQQVYTRSKARQGGGADAGAPAPKMAGLHKRGAAPLPKAGGAMAEALNAFAHKLGTTAPAASAPGGGRGGRGGSGAAASASPMAAAAA